MINDLVDELQKYFNNSLKIKWYGSKDFRSYFVSFEKIMQIGNAVASRFAYHIGKYVINTLQ